MRLKEHIPNTITSMNLLSGVLGVIFTLQGRIDIAFPMMLAASVFDFCDGLVARALHVSSDIGKELDSLSDLVSFGVLPSLMLFQTLEGAGWLRYVPLLIAILSAVRLARFNLDERQHLDFIGLPTPACAMLCASMAYFIQAEPQSALSAFLLRDGVIPVLSVLLALLLVSGIPMFSMKIAPGHRLLDARRICFFILVAVAVAATVILRRNWSLAVLLSFTAYLAVNLAFLPHKLITHE